MSNFDCYNVNDMYSRLLWKVKKDGIVMDSRNGKVKTLRKPMYTRIRHPRERVLFAPNRRPNPFFHLMEALWMLSGRRDVGFVTQFNSQMYTYSDDGEVFNGAYGWRWRNHFGYDQMIRAIEMLKINPLDRRVVISMWDPTEDLGSDSLDIPCNQQCIFRIVEGQLDMLTTNRSNDLIWGLAGANAVHLTVLQEFVASAVGVPLGMWSHVSNNLHLYEHHWSLSPDDINPNDYLQYPRTMPLVKDSSVFLEELCLFLNSDPGYNEYTEPFINDVADPMYDAWKTYKEGDKKGALEIVDCIASEDWRIACRQWLNTTKEQ